MQLLQKPQHELFERGLHVRGDSSLGSAGVLGNFHWPELPTPSGYSSFQRAPSRTCTKCKRDLYTEKFYTKGTNRRESKCKCCALSGKSVAYRRKRSAARRSNVFEIDGSRICEVKLLAATNEMSSLEGLLRDLMLDVILDTREEMR